MPISRLLRRGAASGHVVIQNHKMIVHTPAGTIRVRRHDHRRLRRECLREFRPHAVRARYVLGVSAVELIDGPTLDDQHRLVRPASRRRLEQVPPLIYPRQRGVGVLTRRTRADDAQSRRAHVTPTRRFARSVRRVDRRGGYVLAPIHRHDRHR